ncbi:MAG: alginate lyase family protein [Acidobacteria bacterium]|nr:alginate lyase family protein [Acidobacteriota bacterium]
MSSLTWYLKRLSLMSLEEIGHRVRAAARQWLEWPLHVFSHKAMPLSEFLRLTDQELNLYLARPRHVRFFKLRTGMPPMAISREATVAVADDLLEHRFTFFEFDREPLGDPLLWNYNYKHHRMSPLIYAPRIDYRDERAVGDVKYIWELNRHQHLVPLAKAYHLTGDERYAREVVAQILSWIEQCPYMMGINWTTAEQAGIRLISWIWAYDWVQFASCVTEEFLSRFLQSVYQHVQFITQNYSRHSSANNHLIAEATGVFMATVYFPELKNAARWRAESQAILAEQALQQNHPDGVNGEQATAYHCLVLEYLLLAGLLGEQNGFKFPDAYWAHLEKMMEVVAALMDCRGRLPHLGDDDNGSVVMLGTPLPSRARSILATGAALFERADLLALAPEFDERTFWLLGAGVSARNLYETSGLGFRGEGAGAHRGAPLQMTVRGPVSGRPRLVGDESFCLSLKRQSQAFESGYYIMRSGETAEDEVVTVFDCAPLGYGSLAAHGHADALSLTLTVAGREILIDPGTYVYHSEQTWRNYFRGTSAHNTIRIDEQDQSVIAGNFMWSEKAQAVLECWESFESYDLVRGHHTGYLRLADPVRHRREVTYEKEARVFRIVDTIEATGEHVVEQFFHLSEDCEIHREGQMWKIENDGVQVRLCADEQLELMLIKGQANPPLGWRSRRFGQKQPSPTLVGRMVGVGTGVLVTIVSIKTSAER